MATKVKNELTSKAQRYKEANSFTTVYESGGVDVSLSPDTVKKFLVNGNGNVSDQEIAYFIKLCQAQKLNPFIRDAYLIKYGSESATIVVGKDVFLKRAFRNPTFKGIEAGVVSMDEGGILENHIGTIIPKNRVLVGGWAKIYIDGYNTPIELTVNLEEYIGLKKDGTPNAQWSKRPGTMIRKVAMAQALREAFPEDLQGLYDKDEIDYSDAVKLDEAPIEQPIENKEPPVEADFKEVEEPENYDEDPFA